MKKRAVFMKLQLIFLAFLSLAGAVANDVPNNSFEYDIQPVWNRMPSENIQPGKRPEYTYSCDSVSGKRSLLLNGQKLETAYESSARFRSNSGIFALKMKAPEGPVTVKVKCQFFLNTTHDTFIESSVPNMGR
jgi:hypothetical protein